MTNDTTRPEPADLQALVARVFELDLTEVSAETPFAEDLGVDSLMLLDLAAHIEKRYGIKVGDVEISQVNSLDEVQRLLAIKTTA